MKKMLGFLLIIILGVASVFALACRSEAIDNNMAKGSNAIVLC